MNLAPVLDLSVFTIEVVGADESGIVATVISKLADADISIRQMISKDPEFTNDPELYIITDEPIPGDLLNDLSNLDFVRRITTA